MFGAFALSILNDYIRSKVRCNIVVYFRQRLKKIISKIQIREVFDIILFHLNSCWYEQCMHLYVFTCI